MRYLMTFTYDGSKFYGYQKQPNKITVQEEIEKILTKINSNDQVIIHASGRTDSGVHALNQKAHFDLNNNISVDVLVNSINKMLIPSIYIRSIIEVDDNFHARFNVKKKIYTYKINLGQYNALECDYIYQYNKKLDIKKMIDSSKYFIGKHNFKSFTKGGEEKESYIREIYDINISLDDDILSIQFTGNGFLRYMVRNIVGTLIEVGANKIDVKSIPKILDNKDRRSAGITAPACGLYLFDVIY